MGDKYHSLLQANAKHVKMIEIFRQLKKQAMLFALLKTAERFFAFKQPNVQYQRKANSLEKQHQLSLE